MENKDRVIVTLDKGLKNKAKPLLDEMGMKLSSYLNITLRAFVNSQETSLRKTFEDVADDFIKETRKKKVKAK